jgi:hypothetical protein
MYKKKWIKYLKKINKIQFGGFNVKKEDYIFNIESRKWPKQLDDKFGANSWFYCPLIWIALDRLYSQMNKREILTALGRPEKDRERFFDYSMTKKWMEVLEKCGLLERFENIISAISKYLAKLMINDELFDFLKDELKFNGWHIPANSQVSFAYNFGPDVTLQIKKDFYDPRTTFGYPAKRYIEQLQPLNPFVFFTDISKIYIEDLHANKENKN